MTTSALPHTHLETALWYAAHGIYVGPQYPIDATGNCICWKKGGCTKPGKHPITDKDICPNGSLDYTTDPDTIRRWWGKYPTAGVGYDPARSGIVDVAPDSLKWLAEFERRGIPADAPRYRSSFTPGHEHILLRRPDDCPLHRINRSDEYDLMSSGNSVLPATLAPDAPRAWLTPTPNLNGGLPIAPAWVVAMLKEAAEQKGGRPRRHAQPEGGPGDGVDEEPPVQLTGDDLSIWKGEQPKCKHNGTTERSGSLVKIGRVLLDNRMSRRGIVTELRRRDHQLGWHKFCERKDGEDQYHAIVDFLEHEDRNKLKVITNDIPPINGASDRGTVKPEYVQSL